MATRQQNTYGTGQPDQDRGCWRYPAEPGTKCHQQNRLFTEITEIREFNLCKNHKAGRRMEDWDSYTRGTGFTVWAMPANCKIRRSARELGKAHCEMSVLLRMGGSCDFLQVVRAVVLQTHKATYGFPLELLNGPRAFKGTPIPLLKVTLVTRPLASPPELHPGDEIGLPGACCALTSE
ncbi:unnamed protein product [Arctogadus glacialis]